MHPLPFLNLCILGPGLIGGSLTLAVAQKKAAAHLIIWDQTDSAFPLVHQQLSNQRDVSFETTTDIARAVSGADAIILCVPIHYMAPLVEKIVPHLRSRDVLITDVGSVKGPVMAMISPMISPPGKPRAALFIGGHPMAGGEKAGFSAARGDLFESAQVVLTPPQDVPETEFAPALNRLKHFWQLIGGQPLVLEATLHDKIVAQISHTPHLLAALVAGSLAGPNEALLRKLAATGFRDMTRIAQGDPELWTEILLANSPAVIDCLLELQNLTTQAIELIRDENRPELQNLLKKGQALRQTLQTQPLSQVTKT